MGKQGQKLVYNLAEGPWPGDKYGSEVILNYVT